MSRVELKKDKGTKPWTVEKIKNAVFDNKKKIVVLDNQVLNLKSWESFHPGGKFVLMKNYGRDISKFWYGGYKLV